MPSQSPAIRTRCGSTPILAVALVVLATPLAGCDDITALIGNTDPPRAAEPIGKWQSTCVRPYMYKPTFELERHFYCGEWRQECVGRNGEPRGDCAKS